MNILYVHMGWGMHYPFSPRTWDDQEWFRWLTLVQKKGITGIMLWPGIEFIDIKNNIEISNLNNFLNKRIVDCHSIGLKIWLGRSINHYCCNSSKNFLIRDIRDTIACHITSSEYQDLILAPLKEILKDLPSFEGWWCIDRDPGSALNTSPQAFVNAFRQQFEICESAITPLYWMWAGWSDVLGQDPNWREIEQSYWIDSITAFDQIWGESWKALACWPGHVKSLERFHHTFYTFRYHQIEPEPSIPWSYNRSEKHYYFNLPSTSIGEIYNLQTPCLRTPHLICKLENAESHTTTFDEIEKSWCWSEESLCNMKPLWNLLSTNAHGHEKNLKRWIDLTGTQFPSRRGYLHETFHHQNAP